MPARRHNAVRAMVCSKLADPSVRFILGVEFYAAAATVSPERMERIHRFRPHTIACL